MLTYLIPLIQWLDDKLEAMRVIIEDEKPLDPNLKPYQGLLQIKSETAQHILDQNTFTKNFTIPNNTDQPLEILTNSPLEWLQKKYQLTDFHLKVMVIALAPELDLSYEKLYAYLQDDVRCKRPTIDFTLNLLSINVSEKLKQRQYFSPDAVLLQNRLLYIIPPNDNASLLAHELYLDPQITQYLLQLPGLDPRLSQYTFVHYPQKPPELANLFTPLQKLTRQHWQERQPLYLYLQGGNHLEKQNLIENLAYLEQVPLLIADIPQMIKAKVHWQTTFLLLLRQAELQQQWLYLANMDPLFTESELSNYQILCSTLTDYPSFVILSGEIPHPTTPYTLPLISIPFNLPPFEERYNCWLSELEQRGLTLDPIDLNTLSDRFRLYRHQIVNAVNIAYRQAQWQSYQTRNVDIEAKPSLTDLFAAARIQSGQALTNLARKIEPKYCWTDLVLQPTASAQLQELYNQAKYHHLVMETWGLAAKLSLGKSLNALFTGSPGTGKTMAAEVLAQELQLDLYKIDLSQIVSKYIGETEKNLNQVFTAATNANAILLFDEADALFGKRSEVKDAHDRYANIETSYLLQKMEEYEGMSILTTNFRNNLDEAFVRRLRFIIEFSLPDKNERYQIWQKMLPLNVYYPQELDLDFLSTRFELTGADIRNIILGAAFLAASEKEGTKMITMKHIILAIRRDYKKRGKILMSEDLGKYG